MSTQSQFQNMLNEFLPNSLMDDEFRNRNWFYKNLSQDTNWRGGTMIVPFVGGRNSTVKMGELPAIADIGRLRTVRGEITSQPEIWGSLIFDEKDLIRNNKVDEQSLLRLLPDQIRIFLETMQEVISFNVASGAYFASATADGTAADGIEVDRIDRFEVGQPVVIDDDNSSPMKVWVKELNINTDVVIFATDVNLTTVADVSAYTTAQNTRFYFDGGQTSANRLTSLRLSLLSAANGGSSTLYGQTKTAYPYTQALNRSGAAYTRANFLDQLFADYVEIRVKGKGNPNLFLMSDRMWGVVMASLELQKGAYRQADDMNISEYGFQEVTIVGPRGSAKIVGLHEADDDVIMVMNKSAAKIYSNGGLRKRIGPDGLEFYVVRNTSGYQYIVDVCFQGDVVLEHPSGCGIIHSLPSSLFTP